MVLIFKRGSAVKQQPNVSCASGIKKPSARSASVAPASGSGAMKRAKSTKGASSHATGDPLAAETVEDNADLIKGVAQGASATAAFYDALAEKTKVDATQIKAIMTIMPSVVGAHLSEHGTLKIMGLCTFIKKEIKARGAGEKIICGKTVALKPKGATVSVRASVHASLKRRLS